MMKLENQHDKHHSNNYFKQDSSMDTANSE